MTSPQVFNARQIQTVNSAVAMAEELVSDFFKMSATEWLRPKYDVKTLVDLHSEEIVYGPFAQIIRYEGQHKETSLGSMVYDFYKICLQDHTILDTMSQTPHLQLFPFMLYIVSHELIHIVRFSRFLQRFDASATEKMNEEERVHALTHDLLHPIKVDGLRAVLDFYHRWRMPLEDLSER